MEMLMLKIFDKTFSAFGEHAHTLTDEWTEG